MALPGARLLTSSHTGQIENFEYLTKEEAANLIQETPLTVGDRVYIPRGIVHRGIGGVLAQVITAPGFKPGAEIGVDFHLRRINKHFNLSAKDSLPYNIAASKAVVIKWSPAAQQIFEWNLWNIRYSLWPVWRTLSCNTFCCILASPSTGCETRQFWDLYAWSETFFCKWSSFW